MATFEFRKDPANREWVIIVPKRSKRPDVASGTEPVCPFCWGHEGLTPKEVFRLGGGKANQPGWQIRVIPNKFPFAPIHELIIHSPDHTGSFTTYSSKQISTILGVYKKRYQEHEKKGQVFIFHNHGRQGAESLPVIPPEVLLRIPVLGGVENVVKETQHLVAFCPPSSQWPYEVWIAPKERGQLFGSLDASQTKDLAKLLPALLKKLGKVLKPDFPYNFYLAPGPDWYVRIIPRDKVLGGFEIGTGVFVNTTDPASVARKLRN
jgi:UDPglucose--hexose-1-phosphate uridylyltransferase